MRPGQSVFVDRDYARPLRRNLLEEMSRLPGETRMTFSFDGRVLSIVLCGRPHEVIASGRQLAVLLQCKGFSWVEVAHPRFTSEIGL